MLIKPSDLTPRNAPRAPHDCQTGPETTHYKSDSKIQLVNQPSQTKGAWGTPTVTQTPPIDFFFAY